MKAWAAEGGKIVIKGMFLKRNVVESMGCRGGGKNLIKESQVGSHKGKCVSAMLWAAEGGGKIVIKGMFLIKGML